MTTVLLLGSGGREYTLDHALVADPSVQLHAAPGNPGLAGIGTLHAADPSNPAVVVASTRRVGTDLVVVRPEAPLVAGVAGTVREAGIDCFSPSAVATELEGSKALAEDVMHAIGMPTTSARVCATSGEAAAALDAYGPSYVVKNDSLTADEGIVVTPDRATALAHAEACEKVVTKEFFDEPRFPLFVIYDGTTAVPLLSAQDFKRVGDGNTDPNTDGMGAYCPLPWALDGLVEGVMTRVIAPMLAEMRHRDTPFTGLLYAGPALITRGVRVVEFNVRFDDPETQAVLILLETPLADVLHAASRGELAGLLPLRWCDGAAVVVVEATRGYLGTPVGGGNIDLPADTNRVWTVCAGTKTIGGRLITSGGRVLGIAGLGEDLNQACGHAYEHLSRVDFLDGFHRTDVGIPHWRVREQNSSQTRLS